jgi:hypothetical protein
LSYGIEAQFFEGDEFIIGQQFEDQNVRDQFVKAEI